MKALEYAEDGDIVVYSDCGNTVFGNHKVWQSLFNKMKCYNGIFYYNGSRVERWTRKTVLDKYNGGLKKSHYQIIGNFFIVNIRAKAIMEKWYKDMFDNPDLVMDVPVEKRTLESDRFIEHRHDQAVLSGIAYSMKSEYALLIQPENSERYRPNKQVIFNSRISDSTQRNPFVEPNPIVLILLDYVIKPIRKIQTFLRDTH